LPFLRISKALWKLLLEQPGFVFFWLRSPVFWGHKVSGWHPSLTVLSYDGILSKSSPFDLD
jgi:hypothetical protein